MDTVVDHNPANAAPMMTYMMTYANTPINNDMSAPIPADFADSGLSSLQMSQRMSPTMGIRNPMRNQRIPPSSFSIFSCCTPHLGQITASSSMLAPHFLQNLLMMIPPSHGGSTPMPSLFDFPM